MPRHESYCGVTDGSMVWRWPVRGVLHDSQDTPCVETVLVGWHGSERCRRKMG